MDPELFDSILSQLQAMLFSGRVSFHFYNEPLLHPGLEQFASRTRAAIPAASVELYTNGSLLTEERIGKLFQAGISRFIVTPAESDGAIPLSGFMNSLPLDLRRIITRRSVSDITLTNRGGLLRHLGAEGCALTRCDIPRFLVVVTADGNVLPCFEDFGEKLRMGNIRNETLIGIWQSERYRKFRADLARGLRHLYPVCAGCNRTEVLKAGQMRSDGSKCPSFSVIVTAKTTQGAAPALRSIHALEWPRERIEVLLAVGNNPSAQRNEAARKAKGDLLLFLDDDSRCAPDLLRQYERAIRQFPHAVAFGGPSVYQSGQGDLAHSIQLLFSTWFALGPVRARYRPLGEMRESDERELILCNLVVKRDRIDWNAGFDTRLYPNEENEFLNRLIRGGIGKVIYNPAAQVFRSPRRSWPEFATQIFRYGRGRARHYRICPRFFDALFAVPAIFLLYLGFILAGAGRLSWLWLMPLLIYIVLATVASLQLLARGEPLTAVSRYPLLAFCAHVFYAGGLVAGLAGSGRKIRTPSTAVSLLKALGAREWLCDGVLTAPQGDAKTSGYIPEGASIP